MTGTRPWLHQLAQSQHGATAVEFALVVPMLLMVVMGLFDMTYNMYTSSMLRGAIQQAARNATTEFGAENTTALDESISKAVHAIAPQANVQFARKSYIDYADVGKPEDYTDLDDDGRCDNGEPFEDVNGNGVWDKDRGITGNGGARDAVLYTVDVTYPRAFGMIGLLGFSPNVVAQAKSILRNQPYGPSTHQPPQMGHCL